MAAVIAPSCSASKGEFSPTKKRYKKGKKDGSRYHPAVNHKYGTVW